MCNLCKGGVGTKNGQQPVRAHSPVTSTLCRSIDAEPQPISPFRTATFFSHELRLGGQIHSQLLSDRI